MKWYLKAAEQGLSKAQRSLGSIYANGDGVVVDLIETKRWWRKAAEQGDVNSIMNLELMTL